MAYTKIYSTKDIIAALWAFDGNKRKAAQSIGMTRQQIYNRVEEEVELQETLIDIKEARFEKNVAMVKDTIKIFFQRIQNNEASGSDMLGFLKMWNDDIKDEVGLKSDTIENTDVNETGIDFTYEVIESKDNANEN